MNCPKQNIFNVLEFLFQMFRKGQKETVMQFSVCLKEKLTVFIELVGKKQLEAEAKAY